MSQKAEKPQWLMICDAFQKAGAEGLVSKDCWPQTATTLSIVSALRKGGALRYNGKRRPPAAGGRLQNVIVWDHTPTLQEWAETMMYSNRRQGVRPGKRGRHPEERKVVKVRDGLGSTVEVIITSMLEAALSEAYRRGYVAGARWEVGEDGEFNPEAFKEAWEPRVKSRLDDVTFEGGEELDYGKEAEC